MNPEFLACDGSWMPTETGYVCSGTTQVITLQELREVSFAQLTGEQKAQLTSSFVTFFVLIFVLVKLRQLAKQEQ